MKRDEAWRIACEVKAEMDAGEHMGARENVLRLLTWAYVDMGAGTDLTRDPTVSLEECSLDDLNLKFVPVASA